MNQVHGQPTSGQVDTAPLSKSTPAAVIPYRGPHATIAGESNSPAAGKSPNASYHFPMIDVLRGFASVSVIVYHVIEHISWKAFPLSGIAGDWFRLGWLSVDMFFVISGFVITLSAIRGYSKSDSTSQFRRTFVRRRLSRIVPLHYLTCLVFLAFVMPQMMNLPRIGFHLWTHAAFIHNWHPATQGSINGVNWSLGVEIQFYLLVMLAAPWLARVRPIVLISSCVAISWLWRGAAYALFHDRVAFGANLTWVYTSQVFGMLDLFGWGGLAAVILTRETGGNARIWLDRWWLWLLAAVVVAVPVMKIYWAHASYWTIPAMVVCWRTAMGLVWACLLVTACGLGSGKISRLMTPLRYIGTISYGLYLWHLPVIESLKKTAFVNTPESFLAMTLGLTALLAAGSWHFFEKPFLEKYGK